MGLNFFNGKFSIKSMFLKIKGRYIHRNRFAHVYIFANFITCTFLSINFRLFSRISCSCRLSPCRLSFFRLSSCRLYACRLSACRLSVCPPVACLPVVCLPVACLSVRLSVCPPVACVLSPVFLCPV
jgi:hypothetical protein